MKQIDIALLSQDLTTQIEFVINGDIAAPTLLESQIALIDTLNPHLNAFLSIDESIIDLAIDARGPFYGLGVAVKDNLAVSDLPLTNGMAFNIDNYPNEDALVVSKLKEAGAGIVGKTNLQEGAFGADGVNHDFGNCQNPHQLGFCSGGSSSGSAAAVSACMTPVALGTDTMGSVRIPASYCGIFGFKPSRGAVSHSGLIACHSHFDSIGILSRSAEDLLLVFDVIAGYDETDPQSNQNQFSDVIENHPKIVVPDNLDCLNVEQSIIEDFSYNCELLKGIGWQLIECDFSQINFADARKAGLLLCEKELLGHYGNNPADLHDDFPKFLMGMLQYAAGKSATDFEQAEKTVKAATDAMNALFGLGDFILLPTTPQRAFSFEQKSPVTQADLTCIANFAGLPAVNLPMYTKHNLPIGMQLIGKAGDDYKLLSLAERWQTDTHFEFTLPKEVQGLLKL